MKQYFIYILTNYSNEVIYVGITSNLTKRIFEHKNKLIDGYTKKYNVNKLVYYEQFEDVLSAITREKQLKAGSRQKKINLVMKKNLQFDDLYQDII